MTNLFNIDQRLKDGTIELITLSLSQILLKDNTLFPWIILVPERNEIKEIIDLNKEDRRILMDEIFLLSIVMRKIFSPDKLNIAALGNVVPQLHIHIIARYQTDEAWPNPVFNNGQQKPYEPETLKRVSSKLKESIIQTLHSDF